ncbi:unnamed protein product [Pseudo-nitzschia multistriata]|uniref:peptidylprolyl isomerase n=1 Tax=Pseudo-nitzschia multistriata TaxID=183589 RepID=A0A448ZRT3_9STRA|nr:unnamed protein product [Pseudo-nitzschia multistriata]
MYFTAASSVRILAALLAGIATTHAFTAPHSQTTGLQQQRSVTSLSEAIVARNGLSWEDVEIGTGRNVFPGDQILCYYSGSYQQDASAASGGSNPFFAAIAGGGKGKKITFDETEPGEPAEVVVGRGQVIKGWDIGICGDQTLDIPPMKIGGDRKLIIPAELAYGERGAGDVIPPNTVLEFQVAVLNAERSDPGVSSEVKAKGFAALGGFFLFMAVFGFLLATNIDKIF